MQNATKELLNNRFLNNRPLSAKVRESSESGISSKPSKVLPPFHPSAQNPSDLKFSVTPTTNPSKLDQKRLYEENLSIKMKSNSLSEENTKLRTKISQIEKSLKHPEDPSISSSLPTSLKNSIKDLKQKLRKKTKKIEELKKHKKNCQITEIKIEIKTYIDECTRLRHHLEEIMRQKNISYETLEYEEKLFRLNLDIETLRNENIGYSEILVRLRDEIFQAKEKILELESGSSKKKKLSNAKKLGKIMNEISEVKGKILFDQDFYGNVEVQLADETANLQKINEGISKKLLSTELKLQEQNIILEQMKNQELSSEKSLRRAQTIVYTSKTQGVAKKLKDPPKLFQKIFNISYKKHLMIDVFFSLMDKNSNWVIDIDEICQGLRVHGYKIKRKYVVEAFKVLGIEGNSVSVVELQEYFEKYEYHYFEDESSSEEVIEKPKIVVERLTYNQVTPNLPDWGAEEESLKKSDLVQAIDLFTISRTLTEIQIKMQKIGLKRSELFNSLFGDSPNIEKPHTVFSLTDLILKSPLDLNNKVDITNFSKYLIQPEGVAQYSPSILINAKFNLSELSKKLISLFDDWPIYLEGQFYHVIEGLKDLISTQTVFFLHRCQEIDQKGSGKLRIEEFKSVCHELDCDIDPESWEILTIELYPERYVRYQDFCTLKII